MFMSMLMVTDMDKDVNTGIDTNMNTDRDMDIFERQVFYISCQLTLIQG